MRERETSFARWLTLNYEIADMEVRVDGWVLDASHGYMTLELASDLSFQSILVPFYL